MWLDARRVVFAGGFKAEDARATVKITRPRPNPHALLWAEEGRTFHLVWYLSEIKRPIWFACTFSAKKTNEVPFGFWGAGRVPKRETSPYLWVGRIRNRWCAPARALAKKTITHVEVQALHPTQTNHKTGVRHLLVSVRGLPWAARGFGVSHVRCKPRQAKLEDLSESRGSVCVRNHNPKGRHRNIDIEH